MTSSTALLVERLSGDFSGCRLVERAVPPVAPDECLVKVRAAAINFPDLLMTRGEYQAKPTLPFVPGLEYSGEIAACGADWTGPAGVGDAVVGMCRHGAMQSFITARADSLRPKPAALDFAEAAAYPVVYLTAHVALTRRAAMRPGEWVLVHGASGGVGMACVDMALAGGARVIATSASVEKRGRLASLFPDAVILPSTGFRDAVKALTDGHGADIICDPVGGDVFDESLRCIAFDGRLLVLGFADGRIPVVPVNLPLIKGCSIMGVRAGEYGRRFPDRGTEDLATVHALAASGVIRPTVHARVPLTEWQRGFAMLADRTALGKVVLVPDHAD